MPDDGGTASDPAPSNEEVVVLQRITSHARGNSVAYLALFVALSGTAVAASGKLAANSVGTAQLKNRAVTGRKVAKGTLTGANIKASTLGTVPSATNAANATTAVSATNATNANNAANATNAVSATNAANASNAAQLGGQAPDSFQARVGGTCGSGSAIASIAAAGTVGCQSTNVTQMMGGIATLTPGSTHYLAPEGLTPTPAPTTQTNGDGLGASALAGTAGNLDVGVFTLQPVALTFTLDVNDSPTALTCTVPAGGGACSDSTHAVAIPAGAQVDISQSGGGGLATQIPFGWTDTTSG
jgi:hypothetical protein